MAEQLSGSESDEQDISFCAIKDDIGGGQYEDYEDNSNPIKSRVFLSKSDQDGGDRQGIIPTNAARPSRAENPTAVGPDLTYLWNGSESTGQSASSTSASFESINSEELGESCPLIFSVDDVVRSNQNDQTVTSGNVDHLESDVQPVMVPDMFNKKAFSDTYIPIFVTDCDNITADESVSKDTTISSELRSDVNLYPIFPDQRPNFRYDNYGKGQSSSSEDSLISAPSNLHSNSFVEGSPEYLVNKLDNQIEQLAKTLEGLFVGDAEKSGEDEQNGDANTKESSPEAGREEIMKTVTSTHETWKEFREYLLDLMGETDYLEVQVHDLFKRLQAREDDNLRLRCERREFQTYLEGREQEWKAVEKGLKTELDYFNSKLFDISESKMDWAKETKMLEALMDLQFDREQGIILDTAKQNKLNELKLLVYRQQLLIEELQEDNITLQQEIAGHISTSTGNIPLNLW
ncbi:hypothetical protein LOTGIDRAFT_235158 [Lottia gigantea]|uniref:Uncharacterized protein n=1 Tax=Lottia gigantea TaxID=225164 RepID=V4A103_LOTGI|nr:hypothetical protein LOTGIDRAFT_235158 [Lottia gigantea]ESO86961.1 hypothetical protein LOTGIDRAFT_235158 [Lottia gigantea]